jgi:dihydroorotase-like cyclic amidohydrolase
METALPTLLTLEKRGALSSKRLNEVFHLVPRKILNKPEFQQSTGFLFVDPRASYEIGRSELPGTSENSCFLRTTLTGRIEIRGENTAIYRRS